MSHATHNTDLQPATDRVGIVDLFRLRPRRGDVWEYQMPGSRKKKKTVGRVNRVRHADGRLYPRVEWKRLPKGRYSSIRVKWLLKFGRLIRRQNEVGEP